MNKMEKRLTNNFDELKNKFINNEITDEYFNQQVNGIKNTSIQLFGIFNNVQVYMCENYPR